MAMREFHGDLFTSDAPALAHGVNTYGVMGAGIAVGFKRRSPQMFEKYRYGCKTGRLVPGGMYPFYDEQNSQWVYNLASQDRPGPYARLDWLESSLELMTAHAVEHGVERVALPLIGCGIGGLDWEDVREVLNDVTLVDIDVWHYVP